VKKEIAAEWKSRLRSGKIKQLKAALGNTAGERCCLGVLCDMAVEAGIIPPPNINATAQGKGIILGYGTSGDWNSGTLPEIVKEWAGMRSSVGQWQWDYNSLSLTTLNDTGISFPEIADAIEEHEDNL
jgi:hypothetical protein